MTVNSEKRIKPVDKRDGKNGTFCPPDTVNKKLSEDPREEQPFPPVKQPAAHQERIECAGQQHERIVHQGSLGYIVLNVPQVVDIIKGKKLHVTSKNNDHPNRKSSRNQTEPFPEGASRNASGAQPEQRHPVAAAHDRKTGVERKDQQADLSRRVEPGVKWHKHRGNKHRNVEHPVRQLRRASESHRHPQAGRHAQDPGQHNAARRGRVVMESEVVPCRIQIVFVHPLEESGVSENGRNKQNALPVGMYGADHNRISLTEFSAH